LSDILKYTKLSDIIKIEQRGTGWFILDPKGLSGFRNNDTGKPIIEFGPYATDDAAQKKREILYHIIYGDYS